MSSFIEKTKSAIANRPPNAFLLFLTGFLFAQVILLNIFYTRHPNGGWETATGMFKTSSVLIIFLCALTLCLIALWRSIGVSESSHKEPVILKSL